jgi:hypothetical protein
MSNGDSFPEGKAGCAWSWPPTSKLCLSKACVDLYIHSPIRFLFVVKWAIDNFSSSGSSYVATDGKSASSSWCRAPFGADDQILHFFEWQWLSFFPSSCRAPPLTRGRVCNLQCNHASSSSSYIVTDGQSASSSWCRAPQQILIFFILSRITTYIMWNKHRKFLSGKYCLLHEIPRSPEVLKRRCYMRDIWCM